MIKAYPLMWPEGYRRTPVRKASLFKKSTVPRARRAVEDEIRRLKATNLVISTNLKVRKDGGFVSKQRTPEDPGVAVWFVYKGDLKCIPCDNYEHVWENLYSISKGINALRGLARWGVRDMLDRALTGFVAITDNAGKAKVSNESNWFEILGVDSNVGIDQLKKKYRELIKECHPDVSGVYSEKFFQLKDAFDEGVRQLSLMDS